MRRTATVIGLGLGGIPVTRSVTVAMRRGPNGWESAEEVTMPPLRPGVITEVEVVMDDGIRKVWEVNPTPTTGPPTVLEPMPSEDRADPDYVDADRA